MTDNITIPRATVQQALEALLLPTMKTQQMLIQRDEAIIALRRVLSQQAEPIYKDSTPHLHVGYSAFESWFQAQPFATQIGIKQISRDSYAAGMGDPLVVAASQQQAEPVQEPMAVTREMISAAHAVTMKHNEVILSASMLERIYMAMNQAAMPSKTPFDVCLTCEALARTVMLDQTGRG